ncbi:MAG: helix-turn-helix transcriptional regulator [Bdellovibrionales bacterium]
MERSAVIVETVIRDMAAIRKDKGLSHEALGQAARLHRTTIGQIEAGKIQPTLLTCLKIARALDIDLGAIISKAQL